MAPSHYPNQCWAIINGVLWYLPALICKMSLKIAFFKIDMSTSQRCLKSPQSLSGTYTNPTNGRTKVSISHEWTNHIPFVLCQLASHSWDKAISNSDLETSRSRSWVWSKGKVMQLAQYLINSLPFHFTSIRPTIPEIQLFQNLTLKNPRSRSWVRQMSWRRRMPRLTWRKQTENIKSPQTGVT